MVRSDIKSTITLCYPCVAASNLGPENVMIYGVECCVDVVFASVSRRQTAEVQEQYRSGYTII
jgi:hypothetical protein